MLPKRQVPSLRSHFSLQFFHPWCHQCLPTCPQAKSDVISFPSSVCIFPPSHLTRWLTPGSGLPTFHRRSPGHKERLLCVGPCCVPRSGAAASPLGRSAVPKRLPAQASGRAFLSSVAFRTCVYAGGPQRVPRVRARLLTCPGARPGRAPAFPHLGAHRKKTRQQLFLARP